MGYRFLQELDWVGCTRTQRVQLRDQRLVHHNRNTLLHSSILPRTAIPIHHSSRKLAKPHHRTPIIKKSTDAASTKRLSKQVLWPRTLPTISSVAKDSGLTLHTAVVTSPWRDNRPLNSPSRMAAFRFLKRTVMRYRHNKKENRKRETNQQPKNGGFVRWSANERCILVL